MILQNRDKSPNSLFLVSIMVICLITGLTTPVFSQNVKTNDSTIICNRHPLARSGFGSPDTFLLRKDIDSSLCKTWFIDKFYSSLNDSISCIFDFGIDKVFLKFGFNGSIYADGTGYGFIGGFRISRNNKILITAAGSNAAYYKKTTLNSAYQSFWRSFIQLLHESKYSICGDSLHLFFQTGSAILIDSAKITDTYLNTKKWPSKNADAADADELIKALMDSDSIPKNSLQKR